MLDYLGDAAPDAVRGPYNEGGWWYEREGAHLPGYDASSWNASCSPLVGIGQAGVQVYRATLDLDLPQGSDIPLAFEFELDSDNPHRVLLYVNGWQFGRWVSLFPLVFLGDELHAHCDGFGDVDLFQRTDLRPVIRFQKVS